MADDITVDTITGSPVVATDDDGTRHWPISKLAYGDTTTYTRVDTTNRLPVEGSSVFADNAAFTLGTSKVTVTGAIRDDALSTLSAVETDAVPIRVDSTGALWVNVSSGPAADRTTDNIGASLQVDRLMNDTTAVTPVHVAINVAGNGDNTIVAAQGASNIILVHQVMLMAGGTVNVRFEDGAAGTALTGIMELTAQTGFCLPFSPVGWFKTSANTLLNLELSGAVNVDGVLCYTVIQ